MRRPLATLLLLGLAACAEEGATPAAPAESDFGAIIADMTHEDGFFDIYENEEDGKILALLPAPGEDGTSLRLIHAMRLKAGLGSNPIGLDRGWGNSGQVLRLRKMGANLVIEVENQTYRASAENDLEKQAVADSFGRSFIWSRPIEAVAPDGRLLVDLSGFLTKDMLGLGASLKEDGGGAFSQSEDLTMPAPEATLVFPDNVELESHLTFTSSEPGREVRATAPYPQSVTLTVHHSFVRLPGEGYATRMADPRMGTFVNGFYDYSAPLEGQIRQGYAMRHRLQHEEPGNPESPIAEPIVFYVDPGAPEEIRNALIEGASWWADAFAAAGFPEGYKVEVLPEGAHPLDIRYNVIQWVHRQTRGWSYGGGIADPRTGEFIKGHVILGSQRVRQDRMIFEGLAGADQSGTGRPDDPVELSLARIRQLAAHEVGHALGFGHNFAASTNDRASVMDYPAPWVVWQDGKLDFSKTYDTGIGEWDKITARWLYGEVDPATAEEELDAIVDEARSEGLLYVNDPQGRYVGSAHAKAAVWDNGNDPVAELSNVMQVRRQALQDFDAGVLADGRPLSALREVLVPIYLYHRYQLNAAAKSIGGVTYQYSKTGVDDGGVDPVPAADQTAAIEAVVATLEPSVLRLPKEIVALLEPSAGSLGPVEVFDSHTAPVFDVTAAVETAADLSLAALLDPARAERLVQQHARQAELPSLPDVLDALDEVARSEAANPQEEEIVRTVSARYIAALMELSDTAHSASVQALARERLASWQRASSRLAIGRSDLDKAHDEWLAARIEAYLDRPAPTLSVTQPGPDTPPGSPIGSYETCWHCE